MKLKHLVATSLLALASAGAQAATTLSYINEYNYWGEWGGGGTISSGEELTVQHQTQEQSFVDGWLLVVDEATDWADITINFEDAELVISGVTLTDTTNMGATDWNGTTLTGSGDNWQFDGVLPNDWYYFEVTGDVSGPLGSTYIGSLQATPVPIPPAALLFGSALIGLAGLKRKKAAKELVEA